MFPEMKDCLPPVHLVAKDFVAPENSGKIYVHIPLTSDFHTQPAETAIRHSLEMWLHDRRTLMQIGHPLQRLPLSYLSPQEKDTLMDNGVSYVQESPGCGNLFVPTHNRAGYHIAEMSAFAYIAQTLHHQMTRKRAPVCNDYITWQYRVDDALCGMVTSAALSDIMGDFKVFQSDFENGSVIISFANKNMNSRKYHVMFETRRDGKYCPSIVFTAEVHDALKDCYEHHRILEILA